MSTEPDDCVREPYREADQPGRLDVNGVEWWACDPYPTWFRWDGGDLRVDHARWMPDDRRTAVRDALIDAERAQRELTRAQERVQIAQAALTEALTK